MDPRAGAYGPRLYRINSTGIRLTPCGSGTDVASGRACIRVLTLVTRGKSVGIELVSLPDSLMHQQSVHNGEAEAKHGRDDDR